MNSNVQQEIQFEGTGYYMYQTDVGQVNLTINQ